MKDNINVNGIGDYMVEGTNVSEILRINQAKAQRNEMARQRNIYKGIAEVMVALSVIFAIAFLIIIASRYNQKEIDKCVNAGHNKVFCERNI